MKIHFPLTGFNLSGGIRVVIMIANGLVERGHQVQVTVPAYRSQPPFPLDRHVRLKVLGEEKTSRLGYSRLLVKHASEWGDVLVATNFKTPHLLRKSILRNRSTAKLLYLIQGYEPYTQGTLFEGAFWRRYLNRWLALKSYVKADVRCYVSMAVAEKVGLDRDPWLVHPGLNPAIFYPNPWESTHDQVRIGVIARPGKLKGTQVLFDAANQIRDLHPKIQWNVLRVGDLPEHLPTNTEILTAHNDQDMADFYRSLDIFVMPSLYEGFGLPSLEAMACGTTLITSDVDGAKEFAENEVNCLVVPTGDPRATAEAIRRLVVSASLRKKLARESLKTSNRFTWEKTVDSFEEVLGSIGKME